MKFRSVLYPTSSTRVFGFINKVEWKLWFIEVLDVPDRQEIIDCITLPVKPTKRQIRKLRRQFRKSLWSYDNIGTSHSYGVKPDFVTVTDTGVEYGYFKTSKD